MEFLLLLAVIAFIAAVVLGRSMQRDAEDRETKRIEEDPSVEIQRELTAEPDKAAELEYWWDRHKDGSL